MFNSSKLVIHEEVDLQRVQAFYKQMGPEDINQEHAHSKKWPWLVIMYAAAMAISGWQTFFKGSKNLIKLKFTMDTLMTIALVGAVAIREWREATIVAILFGLNEYLEGLGSQAFLEKLLESVWEQQY